MHVVRQGFADRRVRSDQIGRRIWIIRLKRHDTEPERREAERTGGRYCRYRRSCVICCGRRVEWVCKAKPSSGHKRQDIGSPSGQGRLGCGAPPVTVGVSGPPPAGPPPAPGKVSGPPCAAAGIARMIPPSSRRKNVRPRCSCRNARAAVKLRGLARAQRITLTILGIMIILVRTKKFARHRIAFIEQQTDARAGAEHT